MPGDKSPSPILHQDESTCNIDNELGLTPIKQKSPRHFHAEMKANRAKAESQVQQDFVGSTLDDISVPARLVATEVKQKVQD